MQPFSPLILAQAGEVQAALPGHPARPWELVEAAHGPQAQLAFALLSLTAVFMAIWISSRLFAGPSGTFLRAVKVWFAGIGLGFVLAFAAFLGFPPAIRSGGVAVLVLAGALGCLALLGLVCIPMAVYGMGILRSLAFTVTHVVLNLITSFGLQYAFLGRAPSLEPDMVRQWIPTATPTPVEIDQLRERLRERQAALARRHEALEIRRRHLPPGNEQARADYERERAAYERELEQLHDEAAALPAH